MNSCQRKRGFHGRKRTSCSFCRKRKVKCDGNVPCSTCVKYNNPICDLPSTQELIRPESATKKIKENFASTISNTNTIILPKDIEFDQGSIPTYTNARLSSKVAGNGLDSADTINFSEDKGIVVAISSYNRQYFGPFSWLSLLLSDAYSLPYMRYIFNNRNDFNTVSEDLEVYTRDNHMRRKEDPNNRNISVDQEGYHIIDNSSQTASKCDKCSKNDLNKRIKSILPDKIVIWKLLDYFFSFVHPFFPLVDESDFRTHLEEIIGKAAFTNTKVEGFQVEKRLEYAVMGLLLIFLRISYLSISSSVTSITDHGLEDHGSILSSEREVFLSNPIDIEAFNVAKSCFSQFDFFNCIDIQVLQLVLFIRIYYIYAPEEGDDYDGKISRILNSIIIQMAYSMGLHRDPYYLPFNMNIPRSNDNLNRLIWHFIVCLDYKNTLLTGDPLNTNTFPSDTKIPNLGSYNKKNSNASLEKRIIEVMKKSRNRLKIYKNVIRCVFNAQEGTKVSELVALVTNLEVVLEDDIIMRGHLGKLTEFSFENIMDIKNNLEVRSWLASIYIKLYIHYEQIKNNNLILNYMKKILQISVIEIVPYLSKVFDRRKIKLTENTIFFLIPSLLSSVHKFIFSVSFILIRLKYLEFKLRSIIRSESELEKDHLHEISQDLIFLLQTCFGWVLDFLKSLSKNYFKAWRLYKVHSHIYSIIESNAVYVENRVVISDLWNPLDEKTIKELIDTLQPAVDSIIDSKSTSLFMPATFQNEKSGNVNNFGMDSMEFDSLWFDTFSRSNASEFDSNGIFNPFMPFNMPLDSASLFGFDSINM